MIVYSSLCFQPIFRLSFGLPKIATEISFLAKWRFLPCTKWRFLLWRYEDFCIGEIKISSLAIWRFLYWRNGDFCIGEMEISSPAIWRFLPWRKRDFFSGGMEISFLACARILILSANPMLLVLKRIVSMRRFF